MCCFWASGIPACAECNSCGSRKARANESRSGLCAPVVIGILGRYLKAGKRKADVN